jgi:tetratricopeptide (TPR) repeat protein
MALEILNKNKASQYAKTEAAEFQLYYQKGDYKTAEVLIQKYLRNTIFSMINTMDWYFHIYFVETGDDKKRNELNAINNPKITNEDKIIDICGYIIGLIDLFKQDTPGLFEIELRRVYEYIAYMNTRLGNKEEAMANFIKAVDYAIHYDEWQPDPSKNIPILDKINPVGKVSGNMLSGIMLSLINSDERIEYDLIRNDERFIKCLERLEQLCGTTQKM